MIRLRDAINSYAAFNGVKPSKVRKELAAYLWPNKELKYARVELSRMETGRIPHDFYDKVHLICNYLCTDPNFLFNRT